MNKKLYYEKDTVNLKKKMVQVVQYLLNAEEF